LLKCLWLALFLCAGSLLSARELSDITLYFFPAIGGSPEEREFFDANLPLEIRDVHYKVVDSEDEADFLVSSTISRLGEADSSSRFTLGLMTFADNSPLLELSWDYANMEDLYRWNIGSILMPAPSEEPPSEESAGRRESRFYAGLRGGMSLGEYAFQSTRNYNPGYSVGVSGEGGVVAELRLFRFLALQAEGDFIYETFEASGVSADATFTSMSLMFPLIAKVPLELGKFVLSPYAGAYYAMALGEAGKDADGEKERMPVRTMYPPLGFMAGADLGVSLGPGEFFADVRYGKKLGATVIGEEEGPLYIQDRVSVSFGYKFGFGKRR
jgi:hypothetical protein